MHYTQLRFPVLVRLKQGDYKLEARLGCIVGFCVQGGRSVSQKNQRRLPLVESGEFWKLQRMVSKKGLTM